MPKTMTIGLDTGDEGRDIGPRRRCRTAERRGGYHVDEVAANVWKSRTYISRGRCEEVEELGCGSSVFCFGGVLTRASKNTLALLGVEVRREGGEMTVRPLGEAEVINVRVICCGGNI